MENEKKRIRTILTISFCSVVLLWIFSIPAHAATLSLSPSYSTDTVGDIIPIHVLVSSPDQAVNAVSGIITFPINQLEVVSVSETDSVVSPWVQSPIFSNTQGTINFQGIILNPGFMGVNGNIFTINLKVISSGTININTQSGSILANDGKGTNILSSTNGTIIIASDVTNTTPSEVTPLNNTYANVPTMPTIFSTTNQDQTQWYNNNNPKFSWDVSSGITAVRILYDTHPLSQPTVVYQPPISNKNLENISDGTWYFHVQLKNTSGWSSIGNFTFNIDTTPPHPFHITFANNTTVQNQAPQIFFSTTDDLSGIDHYQMQIDNGAPFVINPTDNPQDGYTLPIQSNGKHTLIIVAYDKAGNKTTETADFTTENQSNPSNEGHIQPAILDTSPVILPYDYTPVIIIVIIIIVGLTLFTFFRRKNTKIKSKIKEQTEIINKNIDKKFYLLRKKIESDIETIEKLSEQVDLSEKKDGIVEQLEKNLDEAKKDIEKDISEMK